MAKSGVCKMVEEKRGVFGTSPTPLYLLSELTDEFGYTMMVVVLWEGD